MGIRTGQQYIESLRDGRRLLIDGKEIRDVTAYAPMKGVIETIAQLHDQQFDPALQDILVCRSPTTGDLVSRTYMASKSLADFKQQAACFHLRTQSTFGLMGRLTDFMSGYLLDDISGLRALGKTEAAERTQALLEHCRENDLVVTHALVDPQSDRSKHEAANEAVRVVERRADGVVVSGCRMLSTLAPLANECYIGPFYPRKPGEEDFAIAFLMPMNAPGLSILARESFHRGSSKFDRPLTSRFDEGDAILVFENVFIPNERLIVNGDIEAYNGMRRASVGVTLLQACTRSTMKLRFLTGLSAAISRTNGRDKTPRFQSAIGELTALVNTAEAIRGGVMAECALRAEAYAAGKPNIEGDGLGEPKTRGGSGGAALQFFFPYATTKAAEVLTMAAGSGVLAMSEADYNNPEVGALIDRWLVGPNTTGHRRMQLMKLAWDMTGTEFGSRAGLYERLYSGDPERNGMNWFAHPITKDCEALVDRLLAS